MNEVERAFDTGDNLHRGKKLLKKSINWLSWKFPGTGLTVYKWPWADDPAHRPFGKLISIQGHGKFMMVGRTTQPIWRQIDSGPSMPYVSVHKIGADYCSQEGIHLLFVIILFEKGSDKKYKIYFYDLDPDKVINESVTFEQERFGDNQYNFGSWILGSRIFSGGVGYHLNKKGVKIND